MVFYTFVLRWLSTRALTNEFITWSHPFLSSLCGLLSVLYVLVTYWRSFFLFWRVVMYVCVRDTIVFLWKKEKEKQKKTLLGRLNVETSLMDSR